MTTDLLLWAENVAPALLEKAMRPDTYFARYPKTSLSHYAEYVLRKSYGRRPMLCSEAKHAMLYGLEQATIAWFESLESHGIGLYPLGGGTK